ncbi:SGNH hydrolase [Lindgomyces ingoldianus]|uniref:SGNH hydrolase n=1 Tax=Lindgomyces ingoldianus TaxID=673940 RepID=A0ACB6QGF8_9PLEO|nr:SGNH hydrolase [Lindgomyces ingoldianus]KAF2466014.1 SGNH hydrolase [Lindgomyces ingoldianus]
MLSFNFRLALRVVVLSLFLRVIASLPLSTRDVIADGIELRILPLGDSITFGYQPQHTNGTNGYRYELANRLSGSNFLFVGTQRSGDMVDNYNEGHSGYTISQIASAVGPGLEMRPNAVLLHAGTNDLNNKVNPDEPYDEAPQRLGALIDQILGVCPDAVVLVAKIINSRTADTESRIKTFNDAIPGVVQQRVDEGHKVMVVDQSAVGADELVDSLHPTDSGYAHMGDIWFEIMKAAAAENLFTSPVGPDPR